MISESQPQLSPVAGEDASLTFSIIVQCNGILIGISHPDGVHISVSYGTEKMKAALCRQLLCLIPERVQSSYVIPITRHYPFTITFSSSYAFWTFRSGKWRYAT